MARFADVLRYHAFHVDARETAQIALRGLTREESVSSAAAEDTADMRAPSEVCA